MLEHVRAQGRTPAGTHVPVLVVEVLDSLRPDVGDVVADCTIGYGGHAREFLDKIGPAGRLIGLDVDAVQLERTALRLGARIEPRRDAQPVRRAEADPAAEQPPLLPPHKVAGEHIDERIRLYHMHFAGLGQALARAGLDGCDVIFADLGVSSMQIDDPRRGFSYKHDGPLDMRMDARLALTAADLLARLSVEELSTALHDLGDEPDHERIAREVALRRKSKPITGTRELVEAIFAAKGLSRRTWRRRNAESHDSLHPAALTFQSLRMLVNDEASGLEQFLRAAPYCLRPGGRIGVISFHSGEDRRVKHAFRDGKRSGIYAEVVEEPVRCSPGEIARNPRSRPAKFRWALRAV